MTEFLQQVLNGVSLGSIYALIALGYTMVYGVIQLINFAHGEILMIGTFSAFFALTVLDTNIAAAVLLAVAASVILGILVERIAYKPLRKSSRLASLITAIGISLLLQNSGLLVFGTEFRAFPRVIPNVHYKFFDGAVTLTGYQILIFVTTILMMLILQYIVMRTRVGKAMRAVSWDKDAAALMGINVDNIITVTFAIGSAFAAVAGVLWACITILYIH